MGKTCHFGLSLLAFLLLGCGMLVGGCDCSDDVDNTAGNLTGANQKKQLDKIKQDLKSIDAERKEAADAVKKQ